jgi:putative restriction endonuclease
MPSLPQPVLFRKIREALPPTTVIKSPTNDTRPTDVTIPSVGPVRIYLWTLTNVAAHLGYRSPDEFKIELILPDQPRGRRGELILAGPQMTVLLGYSPDYGVFVAWEASLHRAFGYSSTVQVREALLEDASGFGWAVGSPRRVRRGREVSVAFTPGNLLRYIKLEREAQHKRLSDIDREAFFLSRTPNLQLMAPPGREDELDEYVAAQRNSILVRRLDRDSRFGPRIKQEYGNACAVCGVQMEIVEGAHIIPITEDNGKDEVWNGIALCPNHHKLFDAYAFVVKPTFQLKVNQPRLAFLRECNKEQGVQHYLVEHENRIIRKPLFFETNEPNRRRILRALQQHERNAALYNDAKTSEGTCMKDMTSKAWQRSGSSIIWSPDLLGSLVLAGESVPLRAALAWTKNSFPESPPGGRSTVLVGGLQTVLESFPPRATDAAFTWLRLNIKPLIRDFQSHWGNVGLVFAMDGPDKLFTFNEADEIVYFGRARSRSEHVRLTLGTWNGAATGDGAFQLLVPETKELGGYHVKHLS